MFRLHILFAAGLIILLHNMIPHYHVENSFGETETTFFVQNETFKIFLESIFNTDIGDGHLENIQVEDNHIKKDLEFFSSDIFVYNNTEKTLVNAVVLRTENSTVQVEEALLKDKFNNNFIERGPPY